MHRAQPDLIVKAALVGEYGVGKTSIFQRYIYDKLSYQPTIGVDFMSNTEHVGEYEVKLHLWDTAGQERFHSIVRTYFRSVYLFILVFDLTNRASFDGLHHWAKEIANETIYGHRLLLVGNKADRHESDRAVTTDEVSAFALAHGIDSHDVYYVSAEAADDPTIVRMFRSTVASVVEHVDHLEPFSGLVTRRDPERTPTVVPPPAPATATWPHTGLAALFGPRPDGLRTPPDEGRRARPSTTNKPSVTWADEAHATVPLGFGGWGGVGGTGWGCC